MRSKFIAFVSLALFVVVLAGCKTSPEAEINKYKSNVDSVTKSIAKYPSVKPVFDSLLSDASAKWAIAEKIPDNEKKIKEMQSVNSLFSSNKTISGLNSYEGQIAKVQKLQKELAENKEKIYQNGIKKNNSEADKSLKEAKTLVDKAKLKTDADGEALFKKANGILISKAGDLERFKKSITPEKAKDKKDDKKDAKKK